jgi:Flp pilus assembly protein TadD
VSTVQESLTRADEAIRAGDDARAEEIYRQILAAHPEHPNGLQGLGILALRGGRHAEAEGYLRRAIAAFPDEAGMHNNLHLALRGLGRTTEALACCRRALELAPQRPELHNNLGIVLKEIGALEPAVASFRRAIELEPRLVNGHFNLANTLLTLGRLDEAERNYRRAIELAPRDWQAQHNLANLLLLEGRFAEAEAAFEASLAIEGSAIDVRRGRARLRLLEGKLDEAWGDLEPRMLDTHPNTPGYAQPVWRGEPLKQRTILICAFRPAADVIQFIRYASLLKELGAVGVHVECPAELHALIRQADGVDRAVATGGSELLDFHVPMLGLPYVFKTTLENIPARVPYLAPDAARVAHWRQKLQDLSGFKVGIAWQGHPRDFGDAFRSVPLETFEPLALPGVTLVSLQTGPGAEQLKRLGDRFRVIDLADSLAAAGKGLAETAAAVANLDLVVTVDTPLAHLAGALGVPVWAALQFAPDWRWLLERSDSPWYPSMRLFRQAHFGAWSEVFNRMADELTSLAAGTKPK